LQPFLRAKFIMFSPDGCAPDGSVALKVSGITAGTSTPDEVIDLVEQGVRGIAAPSPKNHPAEISLSSLNAV